MRKPNPWQLLKSAAEAYGIWQLLAVLGITTVTSSIIIALVAQLRENLNWFGQIILVVGILILALVIVRLVAASIIRRFSPATSRSDTHTLDGLITRVTALERMAKNGQFDISILTDYDPPRFFVIAGPVSNPSHRYSVGDFSLRQYRAYLAKETQIVISLIVEIHVIPRMLVEQMELELMEARHPCINWKSGYMVTNYSRDLEFVIPDSVTPGIHTVRVIARVNGKQRYSAVENISFPER